MSLLHMSLYGGVLVAVVVLVRAVLMDRLPKKTFLFLWAVALGRLLLPFELPSGASVYNAAPVELRAPALTAPLVPAAEEAGGGVDWAALVWLLGAAAVACFFLTTWLRCRREFREALPVEEPFAVDWLRLQGLRRTVRLRQTDRVSAPLTYGILRPVILMPRTMDWTDRDRVRYVLSHELVHIRRLDGLWKLLLMAAVCLHWFNPLVWVMYVLANRDLELSCDESVVTSYGEGARQGYALALLDMEEGRSALRPLCNSFSKNAIEERIRAIMKMKKTTAAAIAAAALTVAIVTVAFATSAKAPAADPAPTPAGSQTAAAQGGSPENALKRTVDAALDLAGVTDEDWNSGVKKTVSAALDLAQGTGEGWESAPKVDPKTGRYYTQAQYDLVAGMKKAGYEKLSIAQFNRELWALMSSGDDEGALSEAYWSLYNELPTDDALASFVYYTVPTSYEEYSARLDEVYSGKRRDPSFEAKAERAEYADVFGDRVQVGYGEIDYSFTYRILDQDGLTVAARDKFLTDITAGMQAFLDAQKAEGLTDEDALGQAAKAELDRLGKAGTTKAISYSAGTIQWACCDYYRD